MFFIFVLLIVAINSMYFNCQVSSVGSSRNERKGTNHSLCGNNPDSSNKFNKSSFFEIYLV